MKKLGLEIENLRVESFTTSPGQDPGRGTVRGHEATLEAACFPEPKDTKSKYWSCVCTPSGQYTCAC